MKKVLIISYYFPPLGLSGVQRAAKFAKYLPEFGWNPTILTVKDIYYYHEDQSLIDEVKHCNIVRTTSLDPLRLKWIFHRKEYNAHKRNTESNMINSKINRFIFPWLFIPDTKILWFPFALIKAIGLIKKHQFHAILTTSPPHSSHLIGYVLNRLFDIPWTADFRDSWLNEKYDPVPTVFHKEMNEWLKRRVICQANHVTAVSKDILNSLKSNSDSDHLHLIYNGYDPQDFHHSKLIKSNQRLTITYCGTINHVLNPELFLKGLQSFLSMYPDTRSKIQVIFVGSIYGINLLEEIHKLNLQDVVKLKGYVKHEKSIQYLIESDILLFLLPSEASAGVITGKLYEYMAAEKPILAIIPEGEAADIIQDYQNIKPIHSEEYHSIAMSIATLYNLWKKKVLCNLVNNTNKDLYNRKLQTKYLAKLLHIV
ncbi:glycosyltransferase [bacterium]